MKKILLSAVVAFSAISGVASAAVVDKVSSKGYATHIYVSDVKKGDHLACVILEDGYAVKTLRTRASAPKMRITTYVTNPTGGTITAVCNSSTPFGAGV